MKMSNIYGVILTAVVVTMLVVTVVIPISQTSSDVSYETADNTGFDYRMAKGNASYSLTITPVSQDASSSTFSIGGTNVTIREGQEQVWLFNNGGVYLHPTQSRVWNANVGTGTQAFAFGDEATQGVTNLVFEAGTMTATTVSGQRTSSYSWVLYPDANGSWAFFDGAFNVSNGEKFYTVFFDNIHAAAGYGTVASMSQLVAASGVSTTYTVSHADSDTYSAVSGVSMTYAGSAVTPIGCIAPVQYNASVVQDSITMTDTIVSIIPVVLVVGVIVMAVSYIVRRND